MERQNSRVGESRWGVNKGRGWGANHAFLPKSSCDAPPSSSSWFSRPPVRRVLLRTWPARQAQRLSRTFSHCPCRPFQGGGQVVIVLFHVAVHESRAPERAQGLRPRLGLAAWCFFVTPVFGLHKVRPNRVFLGRHRSVSAGEMYTDLMSGLY